MREGEHAALAVAYDRHADIVFGSLVRFTGRREVAEDLTQETFLAFWQRAHQFDARAGSLIGWLLGIARNRAIDRIRAARRRPESSLSGSPSIPGWSTETSADDPAEAATLTWTRAVVRAAVRAMPEPERQVLQLAYDGGLSQSEIAQLLGQPLGTVKTRTRRALARLRDVLERVPELPPGRPSLHPADATEGRSHGPR